MVKLHGLAMIIVKMVYCSNIVNFLLKFSLTKNCTDALELSFALFQPNSEQILLQIGWRKFRNEKKNHQWDMQATYIVVPNNKIILGYVSPPPHRVTAWAKPNMGL